MTKRVKQTPQELSSEETSSLEILVNQLRKKIEADESESFGMPTWFLHTGNLALDYAISLKVDGTGGYPGGKIIELFGEPSTGKSLLVAKAGAEIQKIGGLFVVADTEDRWDSEFAATHGVDKYKVIGFHPETVEEFTVKVSDVLDSVENTKVLIALDSVAALSYEKEMKDFDKDREIKSDQGQKAKKIKAAMRILPSKLREKQAILLVTNHVMDNQAYPGARPITPGGRGFKFHASVRIELPKIVPILHEKWKRPIGVTMSVQIPKNSIAPPYGSCEIEMYWKSGVSKYSGLLKVMEDLGIVNQVGGWYKYEDLLSGTLSFRASDLEKIIQEHQEVLTDDRWVKPYFL